MKKDLIVVPCIRFRKSSYLTIQKCILLLFHALGLKDHYNDHQMVHIAHRTLIKSNYFCPKAQELP